MAQAKHKVGDTRENDRLETDKLVPPILALHFILPPPLLSPLLFTRVRDGEGAV